MPNFEREIIAQKAHLYTVRNGKFEHLTGNITRWPRVKKGTFMMDPIPEGRSHFGYDCRLEPGIVYGGTVWFPCPSEESATRLLIEHEQKEIAALERRLKNNRIKLGAAIEHLEELCQE